jgi:hypothetical protein
MLFPAMLYKSPGIHRKPGGGTYDYISVGTQEECDIKLDGGWFSSSDQAVEAAGDMANGLKKPKSEWAMKPIKKKRPSKPLDWRERLNKEPVAIPLPLTESNPIDEYSEPTRAELETKANELGIKFDGRTRDKKLTQLIQDKLSENTGELHGMEQTPIHHTGI